MEQTDYVRKWWKHNYISHSVSPGKLVHLHKINLDSRRFVARARDSHEHISGLRLWNLPRLGQDIDNECLDRYYLFTLAGDGVYLRSICPLKAHLSDVNFTFAWRSIRTKEF